MKKTVFLGTGIIGAGLAANALTAGYDSVLYDICDMQIVKDRMSDIFSSLVDAGAMNRESADAALGRAIYTDDFPEAVGNADIVIEALPERIDLKKETYRKVQEIAGEKALISSTTSAMMPSDLQEGALYPERIIVGHPYNPSYILPLVEVVGGKHTTQSVIDETCSLFENWNKVPIVCRKEQYGFIAQQMNWGMTDTLKKLVADGICSPEDADRALMFGPGLRFPVTGQLMTIALGVDGGWAKFSEKYDGVPASELELELDKSVNEAIAKRPAEMGNTIPDVIRFRDRMIVEMLKMQKML